MYAETGAAGWIMGSMHVSEVILLWLWEYRCRSYQHLRLGAKDVWT
jgi:hypothetical protein